MDEPTPAAPTPSDWREHQDPRIRKHIAYCQNYVARFDHGAPGHLDRHAVDTLAKQLDAQFEITADLARRNVELQAQLNVQPAIATELRRQVQNMRAEHVRLVAAKDGAYAERNKVLVLVALMAQRLGVKVGIGQHVGDDWDAEWRNILFIDLPAGQVSWHIHDDEAQMFYFVGGYGGEWDGHTTEEKYRRVLEPGL